jgi:hypothetical protein
MICWQVLVQVSAPQFGVHAAVDDVGLGGHADPKPPSVALVHPAPLIVRGPPKSATASHTPSMSVGNVWHGTFAV